MATSRQPRAFKPAPVLVTRPATAVPAVTLGSDLCEQSDLPRYSCAHCRGLGDIPILDLDDETPEEKPSGQWGIPVAARYAGKCAGCGTRYTVGEAIRSDGYGDWLLVECCGFDDSR